MFPASSSVLRSASHWAGSGVMKARWAGEVGEVLAGMVDVDDVGGVRIERLGHGPDPGGAVADRDDLPEVLAAAAQVLGLHQAGEGVLAVEGGHVARGAGVRHRVAVVIEAGHGEEPGELDLAGAGLPVLALAWPAFGLARADRDAGAVDLDIQHVRDRLRRGQRADLAGAERGSLCADGRPGGGAGRLGGPLDGLGVHRDPGQVGQQRGGLAERDLRAGPGDHLGQAGRQRGPGHPQLLIPWREAAVASGAVIPGPYHPHRAEHRADGLGPAARVAGLVAGCRT